MWKVTATVQAPGNPATEIIWQKSGSEVGVLMSIAQLFEHNTNATGTQSPDLLAIKIEKV